MKPPYEITSEILKLVASISEKIGEVNSAHLNKPPTELRRKNRIQTIQSSLEIEGNALTIEQVTSLLNNKRVIAPDKDIKEVKNAIKLYNQLNSFNYHSITAFCQAHRTLMDGLIKQPGKFRATEVGIVKGSQVAHLAPPGHMVKPLMRDLFKYIKNDKDLPLIKSCVFHYELEFIHPFVDGNGRMGRLWQTLILMEHYSAFEFLPIEAIVKEWQKDYYSALGKSDKAGKSTIFIQFMLTVIKEALDRLLYSQNVTLSSADRINIYNDKIKKENFSRQDYLRHFKQISSATASRDLKKAVENNLITKFGDKRTTKYKFK